MQTIKMPCEELSDLELVRAFQSKHDVQAYTTLYKRYYPKVELYCLKALEDKQDAQDAAQEVFLKVFEKLPSLQKTELWVAWLFSITRNLVLNIHKKNASNRIADVNDLPFYAEPTQDTEAIKEKERKLEALPKLLNTPDARILKMKYMEGKTIEQLSNNMHLKKSAVKMRLLRARHLVVDRYEKFYAQHA